MRVYLLNQETIDGIARAMSADDAALILAADCPEMCELLAVSEPSTLERAAARARQGMRAASFDARAF